MKFMIESCGHLSLKNFQDFVEHKKEVEILNLNSGFQLKKSFTNVVNMLAIH